MRSQKIDFSNRQVLCVFPDEHSDLTQAISDLRLESDYPVIVLIGGGIGDFEAKVTQQAIQTIAEVAENIHALIICGGTDMGVMAAIGQTRTQNHYQFPLVGVTLEELVAWPGGPSSTNFMGWGKQRWQLEPHYSHFILVPGEKFGDESPWIVEAASLLSKENKSVTILINGGEVSRKDIELSLKHGRPVIALSRTGRLADEISRDIDRDKLITVISANRSERIKEVIKDALAIKEDVTPA